MKLGNVVFGPRNARQQDAKTEQGVTFYQS
jgi:hypothetical protein